VIARAARIVDKLVIGVGLHGSKQRCWMQRRGLSLSSK
jgi:phosphopantetheine adenylyltransferase